MLCAVTGIRSKDGVPASLALGVFMDGVLTQIGHVGSGLTQSDLRQILRAAQPVNAQNDILWIRPALTCWVRFSEWTPDGTLRHPVLIGFAKEDVSRATGEEFVYE